MEQIQDELLSQFGASFYLILWNAHNGSKELEKQESNAIIKWLENGKVRSLLIGDVLPDYQKDRLRYALHPWDTHPNALANEKIAEFLADKIRSGAIQSHPISSQSAQTHTKPSSDDISSSKEEQ